MYQKLNKVFKFEKCHKEEEKNLLQDRKKLLKNRKKI